MAMDNGNSDNGNIINLAQWKPTNKAPARSSTWVAVDPDGEIGMSEEEMLETWGLTEDEMADLTWWGIDFRKSVLLQHAAAMRAPDAERQTQSPKDVLGDQLAIAIGALLISRASVKEIGEMVETLRESDATIASLFQTITRDAMARL